MKRNFTQFFLLALLVLCASIGVQAQSFSKGNFAEERIVAFEEKKRTAGSFVSKRGVAEAAGTMEVKAMNSPLLKSAARESRDVVFLDSVISEIRCMYYEYNDYGWLVSAKVYDFEYEIKQLNVEESFCLDYEFDNKGRLVNYSFFLYNADGSKGAEVERVVTNWAGERARTEKFYSLSDGDYDFESLTLVEEIGYDNYGNPCLYKGYEWNSEAQAMELSDFIEMRFNGCAVVYEYDEDGEYEIEFDEVLMQHYCYYYVSADSYDWLYAYKIDTEEEGLTITKKRYTIEFSSSDEYNLNSIDSYWELSEKEVVTLTPSRNRYASVYYYDSGSNDNVPSVNEGAYSTRSASNMVLDASYLFEWDEYERLVKLEHEDYEGDLSLYTCSYRNDKANEITLADFEMALLAHWEMDETGASVLEGSFYGEVYKEREETENGYEERINDEWDADGNILHSTCSVISYSDEEVGEDVNGDGVISNEREVVNYELWITYDASGNIVTYIEYCDTRDAARAYSKYVPINEQSGNQYLTGWREYDGASKQGPWALVFEDVLVFDEDPAENPNISSVAGWFRSYDHYTKSWSGNKWENKNGILIEYSIDPETGEFITESHTPAARSGEELQEGVNSFYFVDGDWEYHGYKFAQYIYDEATNAEALMVTDGFMEIRYIGEICGYDYTEPADNYSFPYGPLFWGRETELHAGTESEFVVIALKWDSELGDWSVRNGDDYFWAITYYANENGQIVEERKEFGFDSATGRMKVVSSEVAATYSFDAFNRLSSVKYNNFAIYYVYRNDECNYLLESYWIYKSMDVKYNECKYYYSDGRYIYPYTNIEEPIEGEAWSVSGNIITANGEICLYNLNGQIVARGNGRVVAPQGGIYIVEVDGKRAKIAVR